MKIFFLTPFFLMPVTGLHAGPRSSGSYSFTTNSVDGAGRRATSANYSSDGSLGGIGGVSMVVSPAETAKHGYVGQLYEVTALQIVASPATINETGTRQLSGAQLLDDLTTLAVPAGNITWSIQSGPISGISAGGLATAGAIYQNTAATVQGSYAGLTGSLNLTVLNTITDNFGAYAGDGIGDDWQVQFFGLNNSSAGPLLDPDGDGISNLMEYATALSPLLSGVIPMQMVKNGSLLEFTYPRSVSALNGGLNFGVEWSDTMLGNSWQTTGVTQQILSDNGTVQQVKATVPAVSGDHRFVRLKVTAPSL